MNNIVRWYNKNRKMIWTVILSFVAVIAMIQTFNNYYKNKPKDESSSANGGATTSNKNSYSIVSQEKIDNSVSEESIDLIKDFFENCNSGKIEDAYNLLSTQCKEELYPTTDDFISKYYNKIFTEKKSYETMLWITTLNRHTYRVQIMVDLLSSGQKEYMPIEDYYTIVYEEGKYKLNISNYIGKEDINVYKTQNGITVSIISRKMYIDYETYEIEVQNNTGDKLIFNTKDNTNSIYVQDENKLKYIAFLNEVPDNELEILNGITKTLEIRFNRGYKPTIDIQKIIFEDIKINSEQETQKIEIEL